MKSPVISRIYIIVSMVIFGSIGVFIKFIDFPSSYISMCRGLLAFVFMVLFVVVRKKGFNFSAVKKNLLWIVLSGAAIGFNWVLLFESYKFTTVAVSTLFYYFAPVLVIVFSPLFFKEKITLQKIICVIIILVGSVFVSGVLESGARNQVSFAGIALALGAAVLYAFVIIINKKLSAVPAIDRTMVQMLMAGFVMVPYTFLTEDVSSFVFEGKSIIFLLIVCVIHTGVAYLLYFASLDGLPAQTCGILSYIDPAVAVIFSMTILREGVSILGIIGAILIIGGAVLSEISIKKTSI
ncbi:MAG: DMT family transporter [Lachnospiraceae bacterium]|nr:DMT family transporter [Lachnospiraceae bacterium]